MTDKSELTERVVEIVTAYVGNNSVPTSELSGLILSVHSALTGLTSAPAIVEEPQLTPAVPIKKSVSQDFITCLEDGRKFKSLKRHLATKYGMTPEDYRTKWGLPNDYPMVAPSYAAARSKLAKEMGLGASNRKARGKRKAKAAS